MDIRKNFDTDVMSEEYVIVYSEEGVVSQPFETNIYSSRSEI